MKELGIDALMGSLVNYGGDPMLVETEEQAQELLDSIDVLRSITAKAKELYGVEIPAEVFQRNIDAWTNDFKSSTNYGRYAIFTPCGHNDLRFDIDYNISGREEYVA